MHLIIGLMLGAAIIADALARPGPAGHWRRSWPGLWLTGWQAMAGFGLVLALCGSAVTAALVTAGLAAALALVSNIKRRVLGEPLLFTDVVLLQSVFRHPQFYLTALTAWQKAALVLGGAGLLLLLALDFAPQPWPHLWGLGWLALALLVLRASLAAPPWRTLAPLPDVAADVARHGLFATLLLHWQRWRDTPDPPPTSRTLPAPANVELVVIVQCESFADPAELFADPALALPGLAAARQAAWAQGQLLVSGFGAYTMRTEYGVIFGRNEAALGFRRFDPYLTAVGEASHALPAMLARSGWRSLFVHPHDLGFYGRNRILPAAGFAELIGPAAFAAPTDGRYVSDAAIADAIMARAAAAAGPTLIHAVTIENHGPWPADESGSGGRVSRAYLDLVARGDAMLTRLLAELAQLRRPCLLLFYGDHRPSIPGAVLPGGDRHTPFVLLKLGANGAPVARQGPALALTPAELHQLLQDAITA